MKYAIFLQTDDNEWDYLREGDDYSWSSNAPVRLFDAREDALKECKKFNTATVTEYQYDKN